jgi:segregation and condensation protein B
MDETYELQKIKSIIESLIFIGNKPLTIDELKVLLEDIEPSAIKEIAESLKKEFEERASGIRIAEIAGGYQMVTAPENASAIKNFYKIKNSEKLSGPSLETLAIIAYKQPVTRIDIEAVRGVNVDGVVRSLLEKNLIRIVGRKEVIGRPFVYGTTRFFLDYFGLKSLAELPKIEEFAQQDLLKNIQLANPDAEITPLNSEDEELIRKENQGATVSKDSTQASQSEENEDANQTNP